MATFIDTQRNTINALTYVHKSGNANIVILNSTIQGSLFLPLYYLDPSYKIQLADAGGNYSRLVELLKKNQRDDLFNYIILSEDPDEVFIEKLEYDAEVDCPVKYKAKAGLIDEFLAWANKLNKRRGSLWVLGCN